MKIKQLLTCAAICIGMSAYPFNDNLATESLNGGDYLGFATNASTTLLERSLTSENSRKIYDACISNNNIQCASAIAARSTKIDGTIIEDFVDNHYTEKHSSYVEVWVAKNRTAAAVDMIRAYVNSVGLTNAIYNVFVMAHNLNVQGEVMDAARSGMCEFINEIISEEFVRNFVGKPGFPQVSLLISYFDYYNNTSTSMRSRVWKDEYTKKLSNKIYDSLCDDNRAFRMGCRGAFSSEYDRFLSIVAENLHKKFLDAAVKKIIERNIKSPSFYPTETKMKIFRVLADKRISDMSWYSAYSVLSVVGTQDERLDNYLKIDENQSADTINSIIMDINSYDVRYRSSDVAAVLKNINAKYTLKLYDQREAWEPVLSKIRAMIDVR